MHLTRASNTYDALVRCICIHTHTYIRTYINTYTYIYTLIHTHSYTHIYIYISAV